MIKTTVSFALARFVFISCLGLALIITSLVNNHVVELVNTEYEKIAKREINSLNNNYRVFITNHQILLKEQSQEGLFVQALMQPSSNIGKIKDYMDGLTLLGQKYDETLLNFEGSTLYSTVNNTVNYTEYSWLKAMLAGQKSQSIEVINIDGKYFWCIAFPVLYNQQVEGVLLANLPLSTINASEIDIEVLDLSLIHI